MYLQLVTDPGDYFGNYHRQFRLGMSAGVKRLLRGVDKTVWPIELGNPLDINAFYTANLNQIGKGVSVYINDIILFVTLVWNYIM